MSEETVRLIRERMAERIVGQDALVSHLLAAFCAGGHVLLEGPPGVAKTLAALEIARAIGVTFRRVQMTPDLMPGDLLGTSIWLPNEGRFEFRPGPIFTDVLLTDELNRAPPKTQAALLEAMQEHTATIEGVEHRLGDLFWVVATQNPYEHEGTYPLPESQLDRFALKIDVLFPSATEELQILNNHRDRGDALGLARNATGTTISPDDVNRLRNTTRQVHVEPAVLEYIQKIVAQTREQREFLSGAGPRAALALLDLGRGMAVVSGRDYVDPDDVRDLYVPCVGHRVRLAPGALVAGVDASEVLERILRGTAVPEAS